MITTNSARIGKRVQVLAAALAIGATALTLSAGPAEARRNDNGVRCSVDYTHDTFFFLPGEQAWNPGGTRLYVCTPTGTWRQIESPLCPAASRRRGVC